MNIEEFKKIMISYAEKINIKFTEEQLNQFYEYMNLLLEWNEKINLTAITDPNEVILKHFIDSLTINKYIKENSTLADVGTGAGFPGIPLKIAFPKLQIVLADSLNKRIRFLQEVIDTLGLEDVTAVHGRAEEMGRNTLYREQFDLCVSRAVANLSSLSEYCLPFVKTGGAFISYKSGEVDEEATQAKKAIYLLGGEVKDIYKFDLFDQKRSFVVIEKERKTPKAYPRKAGTPTKEPLQ